MNLSNLMRKVLGQAKGIRVIAIRETIKCSVCGALVMPTEMGQPIRAAYTKTAKTDSEGNESSPGNELVKCDICGASVCRNCLKTHIRQVHTNEPEERTDPVKARPSGTSEGRTITKEDLPPPVVLISKRGMRIESGGCCSECHGRADVVWRYAKSNRGVVYLCRLCKPIVFDRSFEGVDAMNRALISPFETSRRRHYRR